MHESGIKGVMQGGTINDGTRDYQPLRSKQYDLKKLHITEMPITWSNCVIYYFNTGLGITAGYHRLWAHTSYKATLPLQIYLAAVGVGAAEGSIRWWSKGHRAHHRYTDTVKDPYSVRKGFIYAHIGWLVMKQNPKRIGRSDITDLNEDPIVVWQHVNYLKCVIFMALIFPTLVCGLGWGDWFGGFVYAGVLRATFVQQATFCINSLAHWLGDQPFDDRNSPRDNWITALQLQKKLDQKRSKLDWGVPLDQLPIIEWDDFVAQSKATDGTGRALVTVAGVVHDVTDFVKEHPGGKALISSAIGKDATAIFNGGVYLHSNAAHNLLSTMRVGVIRGGGEVEMWKRVHAEDKDKLMVRDSGGKPIVRAGDQPTRIGRERECATAA
ncbi:putative acyldesaturase [Diaporthe ampelina]|uniref:stearoyl-CoA 9-desaturase n=1 Tax=Diaporthe ampelina TaxID=1214573 RepID=A0A0G2F5G1_9PEZI|nr:putative acyldesaturase [Diaporthe ampelina]